MIQRWRIQSKIEGGKPGFSRETERHELLEVLKQNPALWESLSSNDRKYLERDLSSFITYDRSDSLAAVFLKRSPGWRKYFYPYPATLLQWEGKDYYFQLNPVLRLSGGVYADSNLTGFYENSRGFEIEGAFDHRFFFYSRILESQRELLPVEQAYLTAYHAVPKIGTIKDFDSRFFPGRMGIDYNGSQGYFGINISRSLQAKIGQGRHFIGSGYRSLLLSNSGKDYFYVQLDWSLGPVFYRNIYSSMIARTHQDIRGDAALPKKYMAAHLLGVKLPYGIQIALYEAIIHARNKHFELSYLNPIIFYKSLEFNLGSPDNAAIGGDIRWDVANKLRLYGQLFIDEFNLGYLRRYKEGWWGNKFAIQLGAFYPDAFHIKHLDLRAEYNFVRPYTYTHRDSIRSYAHYNQALAHPWGANFKEFVVQVSYRPNTRWSLSSRWISGCRGLDLPGENKGSNILISHNEGVTLLGNFTCQGEKHRINIFSLDLTYMFLHNYFLDIRLLRRYEMVPGKGHRYPGDFGYASLGIRANIGVLDINY